MVPGEVGGPEDDRETTDDIAPVAAYDQEEYGVLYEACPVVERAVHPLRPQHTPS